MQGLEDIGTSTGMNHMTFIRDYVSGKEYIQYTGYFCAKSMYVFGVIYMCEERLYICVWREVVCVLMER
jgi:hypothetical protein